MNKTKHLRLIGKSNDELLHSDNLDILIVDEGQQDIIDRLNEKGVHKFNIEIFLEGRKGLFIDLRQSEKLLKKSDFSELMIYDKTFLSEDRLVCDESGNVLGIQLMKFSTLFAEMYRCLMMEGEYYNDILTRNKNKKIELRNEYKEYAVKKESEIFAAAMIYEHVADLIEAFEDQPIELI